MAIGSKRCDQPNRPPPGRLRNKLFRGAGKDRTPRGYSAHGLALARGFMVVRWITTSWLLILLVVCPTGARASANGWYMDCYLVVVRVAPGFRDSTRFRSRIGQVTGRWGSPGESARLAETLVRTQTALVQRLLKLGVLLGPRLEAYSSP